MVWNIYYLEPDGRRQARTTILSFWRVLFRCILKTIFFDGNKNKEMYGQTKNVLQLEQHYRKSNLLYIWRSLLLKILFWNIKAVLNLFRLRQVNYTDSQKLHARAYICCEIEHSEGSKTCSALSGCFAQIFKAPCRLVLGQREKTL